MKLERAKEIVAILTSHHFYEMGFQKEPPGELNFTLREACEARDIIDADPGEKIPGGRRILLSIADRGIALVFALRQYDLARGQSSQVLLHDHKKAIVLADIAACGGLGGKDE